MFLIFFHVFNNFVFFYVFPVLQYFNMFLIRLTFLRFGDIILFFCVAYCTFLNVYPVLTKANNEMLITIALI